MDTKITLSFDESVISRAKEYAADNNISLSRLVEFLLKKITSSKYESMEDFPIADWVFQIGEGQAEYHTKRTRKKAKEEFFNSKK